MAKVCNVSGCGRREWWSGLCASHRGRWEKYGDPLAGPPIRKNIPRSIKTVEGAFRYYMGDSVPETDSCWEWLGGCNTQTGYGVITRNRRKLGAHRVSFEMFNGPLGEGQVVRHSCDNPPCVNPRHLLPGSHQDNTDDRIARGGQFQGRFPVKLDADKVREIRRMSSTVPAQELAAIYGVKIAQIRDVIAGRAWRHVA